VGKNRDKRGVPADLSQFLAAIVAKKKTSASSIFFKKKKKKKTSVFIGVYPWFFTLVFFSKTKKNVPVELTLRERGFFSFYEYILNLTKQSYFAGAHTFAKCNRFLFLELLQNKTPVTSQFL